MTAITDLQTGDRVKLLSHPQIGIFDIATIVKFNKGNVELLCNGKTYIVSENTEVIIPVR